MKALPDGALRQRLTGVYLDVLAARKRLITASRVPLRYPFDIHAESVDGPHAACQIAQGDGYRRTPQVPIGLFASMTIHQTARSTYRLCQRCVVAAVPAGTLTALAGEVAWDALTEGRVRVAMCILAEARPWFLPAPTPPYSCAMIGETSHA